VGRKVYNQAEVAILPKFVPIEPPKIVKPVVEEEYKGPTREEIEAENRRLIEEAKAEAEKIINEAKIEAERIIKEAEDGAFEHIKKANEKAKRIEEEAQDKAQKNYY